MISIFLWVAVGFSMAAASSIDICKPQPPQPNTHASLCAMKGGRCYDVRCHNCTEDLINEFLCPGEYKKCCLRRKPDFACCEFFGDPHIITFDGDHYSVQKEGTFVLSHPCVDEDFEVTGEFYLPEGQTKFTLVKSITVSINNKNGDFLGSAKMDKVGSSLVASVDGVTITQSDLPYKDNKDNIFKIHQVGSTMYIWVPRKGLLVCFNGNLVKVYVTGRHHDKLCGLCGKYNDDVTDDLQGSEQHKTEDNECPADGTEETRVACLEDLMKIKATCGTETPLRKYLHECAHDICIGSQHKQYTLNAMEESCDREMNRMFELMLLEEEPDE